LKYEKSLEEKQEQAALYALGALSQHEARAFEQQLQEGDRQCQTELASFERVVEALGYSATPVQPPAYLFDVLTARLQREDGQSSAPPLQFPERRLETSPSTNQRSLPAAPNNVVEFKRKSAAASFLPWAIAASLAVCSLLALFAWRNAKNETTDLHNQLAAVRNETERYRDGWSQVNERLNEMAQINLALSAPEHRVVDMSGQDVAPTSSAKVYWNLSSKQWVVAANLPPAPEGKVYQLWFVTPNAKISAGLLQTDSRGHGFTVVSVPADVTQVAAAAITLEPTGGSPRPTSPIYVLGKTS
jgi:anti-sigma-K factor RskA